MDKEIEIIYLEADEEIPSVISRLEEAKSENLVLVVPKEAILIHSVINLKLLRREADKRGKKIAIVTKDEAGQNLAKKASFPVYDSIAQAQSLISAKKSDLVLPLKEEKAEEISKTTFAPEISGVPEQAMPRERKAKKPFFPRFKISKIKLVILFSVIALALVGITLYLYLPQAKVSLYLKTEEKEKDLETILAVQPQAQQIKAEIFEKETEKSAKGIATGEKEIGAKSRGKIIISNYWDSTPQILVANTRFQSVSTSRIFRTLSQVSVPGTTIQEGRVVPGTLEVEIIAEEMGAEYNIASDRFIIPGLPQDKQAKIYGESQDPMTGGYKKTVKVITDNDCNEVLAKLKAQVRSQLLKELDKEIKNNKELIKRDDFVFEEEKQSSCSPASGEEAVAFTGQIKLYIAIFAFKQEDLGKGLKEIAESTLDPTKELTDQSFSKIEVLEKKADMSNKKLNLKIKTNLVLRPKLNIEALKANLVGRSREEAESYLNSFEEIEKAEVKFFPNFIKKVPGRSKQIKVNISSL